MKDPYKVSGEFMSITPGDVAPAGNSERYLVTDRAVYGVSADYDGSFSITYKANVDFLTQSGHVSGFMNFEDANGDITLTARFNARSEFVSYDPGDKDHPPTMQLELDGGLTFLDGAHGHAKLHAELTVYLDGGHISDIGGPIDIYGDLPPVDYWT